MLSASRRLHRTPWATALLALLLASLAGAPAAAAGLTLATPFPGMTVRAGEKVSLTLEVDSPTGGIVDLEVVQKPQGWEDPTLKGAGFRVHQVFVTGGKPASVSFEQKVPDGVAEGTYTLTLRARGSAGVADLPLTFRVARPKAAKARLSTQFPEVQGPSGATYTFRVDLYNEADSQQMFNLAAQAPKGWEVQFRPAYDSKRLATIPVEANSSQAIDVEIKVPEKVEAGKYKIPVRAAAGNITASLDLTLELLGRYELAVSTPSGRLSAEATAGRETPVQFTVENRGTAPVEGVSLAGAVPPNWSVTFKPDKIAILAPGESKQVEALLKPDGKAIAGDYLFTVTARGQDTSARAEVRVGVRTSTAWGLVGAGIVIAVVAGVAEVFRRYGRR